MAIYGYTKNYKLIKPQYDTDTWHDYEYDNLDTIDAVLSAIYASGNWKGFWATNTAYVVGDVVIDRDTDTMYKVMFDHTTSEATFAAEQTAHPDYYELWSPNNLAESWAIKTDGKVSNEDYSAKAYAISSGLIDDGSAKEWAIGSGAIGNTNEYSAKKYATDAHNDYISMTTNANVVTVGSNINNVNVVGQSISSVNTVASNLPAVNTVAGVSTDVTTVAGIASSVPTVANNDANITTVATNISDVNTAATNIEAIQDAYNNANTAQTMATQASQSASEAAQSATNAAISAAGTHFKLFHHQWFDYELNDLAWLRADTFSWQSGTVYTNAYNHLVDDIDGITPSTETVGGQTVTFYRATDGHKIVLANQETTVNNIYTATGVAWYYILDTVNNRFKLPRTKYDFNGLRGNVGDYIPESLPNITGNITGTVYRGANGAFSQTATYEWSGTSSFTGPSDFDFNASRSSSTYQDNAPVQQRGTQQYLYFYVGQYTQSAIEQTAGLNSELFNNKIDIDGNNVITAGANKILNTSSYTTNRILEIPQDIKLEIDSNGKCWLKAGSKCYKPNGTVINIVNDIAVGRTTTAQEFIGVAGDGSKIDLNVQPSQCYSGTTAPTGFSGYGLWLDTNTMTYKYSTDGGSTWSYVDCSLPIALVTMKNVNGEVASIDQVFNGFGYIGSTVFALPGVKGQIPNGRNKDGTCKATLTTLTSVKTRTFTGAAQLGWYLQPDGASAGNSPVYSDTQPSQNRVRWFSKKDNQWYDTHESPELNRKTYVLPLAVFNTDSTGKITSFTPYTVDSIANSNASNFSQAGESYLSGLGMPSGRYIDLTLGASGSTYTAPANGWLILNKTATNVGQEIRLTNKSNQLSGYATSAMSPAELDTMIPCRKGDTIHIYYSAAGSVEDFRFVYAEGEN